jgi:ADP-ribose pyrophosphatase
MVPEKAEIVFTCRKFRVERVTGADNQGRPYTREIVRHPGAVAVIPMLEDGRVCLIKNFRVSVGQTLIELPAGTLDENEDPAHTAARELTEETGYRAGEISPLRDFFLSPGILDERMHLYVATRLAAGVPDREPGEQIENWIVPWDEAISLVHQGKIEDAKTIVGLLYYDHLLRRDQ